MLRSVERDDSDDGDGDATGAGRDARRGRVDELLGRPVSMRAMALLRILVAPIVLLHLRPMLEDAWHGAHLPRPLPRAVRVVVPGAAARRSTSPLLWMAAFAAVAMAVGFRARAATITVWAIVTYDLFLSTTNFHNNRAYLVLVLAALAVTPCDRELSLDAWLARRRGDPPRADDVAGLAAVAAALRGRHGLRRVRPQQAARPRLVQRRGDVAPPRAHAPPARRVGAAAVVGRPADGPVVQHGVGQVRHRHRAVHRRSACGRAARATPRCGSPCASTSPSSCRRRSRCSRTWPSPPS